MFRFDDLEAEDILTPASHCAVAADATKDEVLVFSQHRLSRLPVAGSIDEIVGVINLKDSTTKWFREYFLALCSRQFLYCFHPGEHSHEPAAAEKALLLWW